MSLCIKEHCSADKLTLASFQFNSVKQITKTKQNKKTNLEQTACWAFPDENDMILVFNSDSLIPVSLQEFALMIIAIIIYNTYVPGTVLHLQTHPVDRIDRIETFL